VFDRPDSGETAVLVSLALGRREEQQHLAEFQELAESAGVEVKDILTGARAVPEARYFIGVGKAEELREMVEQTCAEIVLVNHALSPAQQRNLERFVDLALESVSARKSRELGAIFSDVLREAQAEGLALVIYERQQTIYHLTVASPLADR